MLKYRILTACVLIPLVLWGLFSATAPVFAGVTGLMISYAAWEWSNLSAIHSLVWRFMYVAWLAALCIGLYLLHARHAAHTLILVILSLGIFWWLIALLIVLCYPRGKQVWAAHPVWRALMGIVTLLPCWLSLNVLFSLAAHGTLLLLLFLIIWGADTGAYFSGKAYGRHALLPHVSPGKTWEGFAGAALVACFCVPLAHYFLIPTLPLPALLTLVSVSFLFSVLGDLLESVLKRERGVKDSGHFLPGHGGLLDRIDSLTAAAPVFAWVYLLLA